MRYTIGYLAGCIIEHAILLMVSGGIKAIMMVTGGSRIIMTGIRVTKAIIKCVLSNVTAEDKHMLSINNNYDKREKKVLELYDQGKSTRDIAKDLTADEIARRKGEKPSPGTIYPALKNLREMGFVSSDDQKEGKTIIYTLTERGKNALRISKRRFIRTFLGVFP